MRSTRQRIVPPAHRGAGRLHLTGSTVVANTAPIAETSRLLAALQKAVTFLSAAVMQDSTRPTISSQLRRQTALLLTPQLAPGSLVISVVSREPETPTEPSLIPTATAADTGVRALLELCQTAGSDGLATELGARLRSLGPRAARTILQLSDAVLTDDIQLEVSWRATDHTSVQGKLGHQEAAAISRAIQEGRIEVERVRLVGYLRTISQIPHVPLDLIMDSGGRVQLRATEDQRSRLGPLYDTRVTVVADETVVTSAKGQGRTQYDLIEIKSYEPGDTSSDLDEETELPIAPRPPD